MLDEETLEKQAAMIAGLVVNKLTNQPLLVNQSRLAELSGVSVSTIDRLLHENVISAIRIRRRKLFDPEQVISEIKRHQSQQWLSEAASDFCSSILKTDNSN